MEEYAKRGRIWVWFNPPNPPIIVLRQATIRIVGEDENLGVKVMIDNGIIFCQVSNTRQIGHLIAFITWGSQKWNGATPSFIRRPNIIRG